MKKPVVSLLIPLLIVMPVMGGGTAQAQRNCDNPVGAFDSVYCHAKVLIKTDDDMNTTYQKLMTQLGPKGKQLLIKTQRVWLTKRNSDCASTDGTSNTLHNECAVNMTKSRLDFLNERLRECLSSGCQLSKLNE